MPNKISDHITYEEATKSQTAIRLGISNEPTVAQLKAMQNVAEKVFEPTRNHFNIPIAVTSFFRSVQLNRAIGGSSRSQHCNGEAIDMDADVFGGVTNQQIYEYVRDNLDFDQLIHEHGTESNPAWVHVSYKLVGPNRRQIIRAYRDRAGVTRYKLWR